MRGAFVLATFAIAACGNRSSLAPDAAADARRIGDPCTLGVGEVCGRDPGTCGGGPGALCIAPVCDQSFRGGYCSRLCGSDNPTDPHCPADSTCVAFGLRNQFLHRCMRACTTDEDCRLVDYRCLPVREGGSACLPDLGCAPVPAAGLESAAFQHPNLRVPGSAGGLYQAEGNLVTDDRGHLAASAIEFAFTDAMTVVPYDATTGLFGGVSRFSNLDPASVETTDPVVAYDRTAPGGTPLLYLSWMEVGSTNASTVYVARSRDFGVTWDEPRAVSADDGEPGRFLDKPWVAAGAGRVIVAWTGGQDLRAVYSSDGGDSFTAPAIAVLGRPLAAQFAQVAVAESGAAILCWLAGPPDPPGAAQVRAARFRSAAQGFVDAQLLGGSEQATYHPPACAISPDGRIAYVVWMNGLITGETDIVSATSEDVAESFTFHPGVVVSGDPSCGVRIHPTVAVDLQGRGHVLWLDNYFHGGVARYTASLDRAGQRFSPPEVASDGPPWPFTVSRAPGLWLGDYVGIALDSSRVWVYYNGTQEDERTHFYLTWRALAP